jgi:hypothetical protein
MVVLAVSQIFWARGVEEALMQGTLQVCCSMLCSTVGAAHACWLPHLMFCSTCSQDLGDQACKAATPNPHPVDLHRHLHGCLQAFLDRSNSDLLGLTDLVQADLMDAERLALGALITVDVHACDVVRELLKAGIKQTSDFQWVSRLRYYWRDDVFVDMAQASIAYGYEYLGNSPRLVITPLTDRCYMTLMSAMHLNLGGAPAGPAGTGK